MGSKRKFYLVGLLLAGTAAMGVAGCDPVKDTASNAVATTTEHLSKHELKNRHIDVDSLSCDAHHSKHKDEVDCDGRTTDGQKITVKGVVTEQLKDFCIRGRLTGKVGDKTIFNVGNLGNCVLKTKTWTFNG